MYKSVSAPLLNFDEPSFQEDPQESWDGSYATANLPFSLKLSKSNNQERRRSFEQDSDAFEHVLDTAMKRTAARQKARDREAEFLSNPHEKLKSLPRTKRELYATVQKLRAIRSENENRIDDLNRAMVLHRSTTRRQAIRIAKLEEQLEERDQRENELRQEIASARGKLWKAQTSTGIAEKGLKSLKETRIEMAKNLEIQEKRLEKALQLQKEEFQEQLREETKSKFDEQEKKTSITINKAVANALRERDQIAREHKDEVEAKMEAKLNASVSQALRKQKEWMLKEEEKMMDGVKKTEAHLMQEHKSMQLEIHAAELASAAGKSSELIKELRRELVEQKKYHEARVQRADATHDREMAQLIEQQGNIEILKVRERTAKLRVRDLENENALLQSQVIELRNGFVQGLQESIPLGDVLPYPDNMERDMEMMGLWNI